MSSFLGGSDEAQGSEPTQEPVANNQPQGDQPQGSEPQLPGWTAGLKAEVKEKFKDRLGDFKTISDIIPDYFELKDKMSKAIIKPGENATEEELSKYREAMGIPGDPSGYDLDTSGVPEGLVHEEDLGFFKETFHKAGLNQNQAQNVYREIMRVLGESSLAKADEQKAEIEKVRQDIAQTFGGDAAKAEAAVQKVMQEFSDPELLKHLNETGIGNDPYLVRLLAKVGMQMLDDNLAQGSGNVPQQQESKPYMTYPKMEEYYGNT
jgi:hypothetical protein